LRRALWGDDMPAKKTPSAKSNGLRQRAEAKLKDKKTPAAPLTAAETKRLVHELQVHQIELEMQNEELRAAQAELEASRARYFDLYDMAPIGYLTLGEKGLVREANLAAAALLGVTRSAVVRKPLFRFVAPEDHDVYFRNFHQLCEADSPHVCELRMLRAGAAPFWARIEATAAQDADGAPICRAVISDITEQKAAQALRQSQALLRTIAEATPIPISLMRVSDGAILFTNRVYNDTFGYTGAELEGRHAPDFYADSADRTKLLSIVRTQGFVRDYQVRLKRADGTPIWGSTSVHAIDFAGEPALLGATIDITERKRAADALRDSEERFRLALLNSPVSLTAQDRDLHVVWNHNARVVPSATGTIGKTDAEIFPPEEAEALVAFKRTVMETGREARRPFWLTGSPGRRRYFDLTVVPARDALGEVVGVYTAALDLTESRLAEEALRRKEAELAEAQRIAHIGSWHWDAATDVTTGTDELLRIYGLDPATQPMPDFNDQDGRLYPHESWQQVNAAVQETMRTGVGYKLDVPALRNGEPIWITTRSEVVRDAAGRIVGLLGTVQDITERRAAEEALRESEERYRTLFDTMTEGFSLDEIVFDDAGRPADIRYLAVNPAFERQTGLRAAELIGRTTLELFPDAEREWLDRYGEVTLTGEPAHFEARFGPLDRWFEVSAFRTEPGRFAVVFVDISERKLAEEALRQRSAEVEAARTAAENEKRRLEAAMEALPTGLAVLDDKGGVVRSNRAFQEIWGQPPPTDSYADHAAYRAWWPDTGRPVEPEEWAAPRAAQSGVAVKDQLVKIQRFDGSRGFVLNSAAPVRDAAGRVVGCVVAIRDITDLRRAEEALRESEEKYRQFVETAHEGVWAVDAETKTTYVNRRMAEMLGYEPAEMLGRKTAEFLDEDEAHLVLERLERRRQGSVDTSEIRYRRRDGSVVWALTTASPLHDKEENFAGTLGMLTDITDRKRVEAALRESEERYRTLFNTMDEGFCIIEVIFDAADRPIDYRFLRINAAFERQTGLHDAEGKLMKSLAPDHEAHWFEIYGEIAKTGTPLHFLNEAKALNRYYEVSAYRVGRPEDRQVAIIFNDISERQRAAEEVRASRAKLDAALASMTDAVFISDDAGQFIEFNDAFATFHRFKTKAECAKQFADYPDIIDVFLPNGDVAPLDMWAVPRALRGETVTNAEYGLRRKDTGEAWVGSYSFSAIRGNDGAIVGSVVVARDITDRKRAEEALRELNATLERRVHERTAELERRALQLRALTSQLAQAEEQERKRLAQVLHDHLQQLLVAAKFGASSLRQQAVDPNLKAEAQRVLDLLGQSIDASRSLTAELSPPVLHDAGLAAGLMWLARWMRDKHGLTVEVSADDLPVPLPEALRLMSYQAVRELLFNVVKHAGVASARVAMTHDEGRNLRIVVSDRGRGFDAAAYAAGDAPGSFGLLNIRERLAFLDGRLEIESAPGQGTRFILTAPLPAPVAAEPAEAAPPSAAAAISPASAPGAIRVLVADDHTVVRKGLVELLKKEPRLAIVGEAADGRQAVEQARQLRPDVVLMDVTMPIMSGVEATRVLSTEMPAVRVIGLSMHAEDDMAAQMRAAGAVRYLVKDGPMEELVKAIVDVAG